MKWHLPKDFLPASPLPFLGSLSWGPVCGSLQHRAVWSFPGFCCLKLTHSTSHHITMQLTWGEVGRQSAGYSAIPETSAQPTWGKIGSLPVPPPMKLQQEVCAQEPSLISEDNDPCAQVLVMCHYVLLQPKDLSSRDTWHTAKTSPLIAAEMFQVFTLHHLLTSIWVGKRRGLWEPDDK